MQALTNTSNGNGMQTLLDQLFAASRETDRAIAERREMTHCKKLSSEIRCSPFYDAMYQVFLDEKARFDVHSRSTFQPDHTLEERERRLNQMLVNESVIPNQNGRFQIQNSKEPPNEEYVQQLRLLSNQFNQQSIDVEGRTYEIHGQLTNCLHEQCFIRPVSDVDLQAIRLHFAQKLDQLRLQIKLETCQTALMLRTKLQENRKKRRNFSKEATQILNDYYFAHLDNPYPSDQVKAELSTMTGLTIGQVSNWFGNKRIRHHKKLNKEKPAEE